MIYLGIALAIVVVSTVLVLAFVLPRRRAGTLRAPRHAVDTRPVGEVEPAAPIESAAQPRAPPPTSTVETPEPTAGRLLRLRARLSRSQTVLGRGLLSVLSREEPRRPGLGRGRGGAADRRCRRRRDDRDRRAAQDPHQGARHPIAGGAAGAAGRRTRRRPAAGPGPFLHTLPSASDPRSCWWSVSTAPARRRRAASSRGCWSPTAARCCSAPPTRSGAAAADQLQTWGSRVGAETVRGPEGGDPASVAFEAVKRGTDAKVDTVLIDTAGRLHTKVGLMDELGKVKRVVERQGPSTRRCSCSTPPRARTG